MSRTITAQIADQSIGTGSNKGEGLFPQKLSLQSGTHSYAVEARVVNGAIGYLKQEVIVRYAVSPTSYTAAQAVQALRQSARYVGLFMGPNAGDDRARISLLEPANGTYLYLWCECPTLDTAATLHVTVVEHVV